MALTFTEFPLRWQSAQQPVIYEFGYEIVLPPLDTENPDYIGSYVSDNDGGFLRILAADTQTQPSVGSSFYVAFGTELRYPLPVRILEKKDVVFGGGDVYIGYVTDTVFGGGYGVDLYTLDFVEQFNPTLRLFIDDDDQGAIRYDRKIDGTFRVNLSPYLRRQFRDISFPGLDIGDENNLFVKYRLDYTINGVTTTGDDKYALNSMLQPENPSCSDNLPNWQFDLSTLQCEQTSPRTNSNRVARQRDTNPNSPTYNTLRDSGALFYYDSLASACPVTFSNVARSQQFRRNNCLPSQTGSFVTYTVNAGEYTSLISQADANAQADADIAANGQTYANSTGTCTTLEAFFDYRELSNDYPSGGGTITTADLYIVYPAAGPVTLYYDDIVILDTVPGTPTVRSVALTGTEVLVFAAIIITDTSVSPSYQRTFEDIRLTP